MTFFKKLFGRAENPKKPDALEQGDIGPMPTRKINFKFPPIPENGSMLAKLFVDTVRNMEDLSLDYSVDTIDFIDDFLQRFSEEDITVNDFAETIAVAGIYVGEVLVINNNGIWIKQEDANLPQGVTMFPIVVKLPNGNIVDPIAKAFKRFYYGESDSIRYFYEVFTKS